MTDTKQIDFCQTCGVMTKVLMDDDGKRYCGKCKLPRFRPEHLKRMGVTIQRGSNGN